MASIYSNVGAGPARGEWNCRPEEFWGSFRHTVLWVARVLPSLGLAGFWLWLSFLTDVEPLYRWLIAGAIAGVVFGVNFVLTMRSGATKKKNNFHVVVKFFANNSITTEATIEVCNKFQTLGSAPADPEKSDFDTDEVVPLQNLLPRLYSLQRAADGKHGLLRIDKRDFGWEFKCQRGVFAFAAIIVDAFLAVLVAIITTALFPASLFVVGFLTLAALLADAVKLLLPRQLMLTVRRREKLHIVDVVWFETNPITGVHRRWASFGSAQRLIDFCDAVAGFKNLKITKISIDEPKPTAQDVEHDHSLMNASR